MDRETVPTVLDGPKPVDTALPADKAASARAAAERIRGRMQLVIEGAVAIGNDRIEQKSIPVHGNHLTSIESEFQ
ncbi:hypothetical protein KHC28_24235 [Ancylobacter sonchi]|uniref:hypothetical protein n=1 Tax=Ancylobacter sonchi TaxID=1937790 RepID=UPI001BD54AA0|nr:hypothetical protein [Ancylobacter sonchi]MBS7536757.1 hypothetical protein [Ancylobacter sonchi]